MKKTVAFICAIAISLCICSCTENTTNTPNTDKQDVQTESLKTPSSQIKRGTLSENEYKNESIGFTFTKPNEWIFYTDEQLAPLMDTVPKEGKIDDALFQDCLENKPTCLDMIATDPESETNVLVSFDKIEESEKGISPKDYIDKQVEHLKSSMTAEVLDSTPVNLGTNEYLRVTTSINVGKTSMIQIYYCRSMDSHMGCVIVTLPSDKYSTADIESMFS